MNNGAKNARAIIRLLIPAPADPTMPTAPIRIIGVWVMVHVAAVTGIIAPAPSPGGAGMGGKSDEHQCKAAHRHKQCRKPFHRTPRPLQATRTRAKTEKPRACLQALVLAPILARPKALRKPPSLGVRRAKRQTRSSAPASGPDHEFRQSAAG
jgi:hypothetical protein